jgi:hypothetical protein
VAKQKITGLSASLLSQPVPAPVELKEPEPAPIAPPEPAPAPVVSAPRPVVQTVKVPPDVYIRLKTAGAESRRSSQDIILAALREYLDHFSSKY